MAKKETKLKAAEPFPADAFKKTKQDFPKAGATGAGIDDIAPLTFFFASSADTVQGWGRGTTHLRDRQLREFWRGETMLASALYNVSARNAAYEWEIEADSEPLEEALTLMFNNAIVQNGRGWIPFIMALSEDYYGTDNGAFIEIIRDEGGTLKRNEAPVIGVAHLDSNRCTRTGNPSIPVVYRDRIGRAHRMPWYSIISLSEFPSSIETMNGVGFCAVSRVLKHAQIMRNLAIYKDEKVSGRFFRAIHFVGGVSRKEIEDMQNRGEEEADNAGQTRFIMPQIIASLDPEKAVSTVSIDLASLPDNFELDEELRWYINGLALGFGVDYQDFAPLPGGNIGSSAQSEILHRKSRGKGPAVFMQTLENVFLYNGVIPTRTKFVFIEKDMFEEAEKQELRTKQAEELAILVGRGVLRPQDARQILVDRGFMEQEDISSIPEEYGISIVDRGQGDNQFIGSRGGNTIGEDAGRTKQVSQALEIGNDIGNYFSDFENNIRNSVSNVFKKQRQVVDAQEEKTRDLITSVEGWIETRDASQQDRQEQSRKESSKSQKKSMAAQKELVGKLDQLGKDISKELGKQKKKEGLTAHRLDEIGKEVSAVGEFLSEMNGNEDLVVSERDDDGRVKETVKYRNGKIVETLTIVERDVDGRAKRVKKERV